MTDTLLVLNAGSSSIKFQLYAVVPDATPKMKIKGQIEGIGASPRFTAKDAVGEHLVDEALAGADIPDVTHAVPALNAWLETRLGDDRLLAVGHRVVHGGPDLAKPVAVDDAVMEALEALVPLAPLHQPNNLAPIRAFRLSRPDLRQVACFDTAFHRGHPEVADRFAIADELHREGIRRYGFHGLSYEYIESVLPAVDPCLAIGRTVVAHLGSGASMCALCDGRSHDSTMSFTPVDGLPMGTRTGQIDPAVILHLMTTKGWDAARIERFLYHDSGLKGLSGVSSDMRELVASEKPLAKLAVEYFVYHIVKELGAMAAAMGGIDGLVFTAGIGENSAPIRAMVLERAAWLGFDLDPAANDAHGPRITTPTSRLPAHVVATDEELVIARQTLSILRADSDR